MVIGARAQASGDPTAGKNKYNKMGKIKYPAKVRLITGLLFSNDDLRIDVENRLKSLYGKFLNKSEIYSFKHTQYYKDEMGDNVKRCYYAFENLIEVSDLACIKCKTNDIEDELAVDGKRRVNIDPGYVGLPKLVLASTKDFSHRIYIGNGIFAEITLIFKKDTFAAIASGS